MTFHQHHGGSCVIDTGGVAGGNSSLFVEGRLEPSEILYGRIGAGRFVGSEERAARTAFEFDRYDLALELPGFDRIQRAAMALDREFVLVFTGYAPFASHVFRGVAHVDFVEGVSQ